MIKSLGVFKDFSDESLKSVFETEENRIIEMTLLFNKDQIDVVCVPTHHFCNLGCKMCHLTNNKLNKAMVPIKKENFMECIEMALVDEKGMRRTNKKKLLISFMGVGEPLLNIKLIQEVYNEEQYLKEKLGYDTIGYAISTMMPNDNVIKLADIVNKLNIPLKVHFSMHTPIDKNRYELIPSTISIEEALSYLNIYRETIQNNEKIMSEYIKLHRTNDPVEIHYTLIKGINDGETELNLLCELLKKYKITIKFIKFNPLNDLEISEKEEKWVNTIKQEVPNLRVKTYSPPGRQIGSSCGEFTKHYYHQEIETKEQEEEFKEWKKKHQIFE